MSDAQPAGDPVGTLGEEAVKLLAAVSSWAHDHGDGPAEPTADAGRSAHPTCRWCPLCQAAASARSASPELREQLVVAGLALTAAARTFLESLAAAPGPGRPATDVEHIDLRDDDGGAQPWD